MNIRFSASSTGTRNFGGIAKNLITDFGGTNDAAFTAFREWAIANQGNSQIILTLDSGQTFTTANYENGVLFYGVKNLIVMAYGATFNTTAGLAIGGPGIVEDDTRHAKVTTVSAGTSAVTLITPAEAARFAAGQWCMMGGCDLQADASGYGYPPNCAIFEYAQILSIAGAVITFTAPLKYSYKSTWPVFYGGSVSRPYHAGAAALYSLPLEWNVRQEVRGLTLNSVGQTHCRGRHVILRDCTVTDNAGAIPTQARLVEWFNVTHTSTTHAQEADKLVETWTLDGCSMLGLIFQSSTLRDVTLTDCTLTGTLNGTPYNLTAVNCTFPVAQYGCYGYGWSNAITLTGCTIGVSGPLHVEETGIATSFTMSSGVMERPIATGAVRWAVPGATCYFRDASAVQYPFTVTDITQSGSNVRVHTSLGGGFPAGGALSVLTVAPTPVIT